MTTAERKLNYYVDPPREYFHHIGQSVLNRINNIEKRDCLLLVTLGAWFNEYNTFPDQIEFFHEWLLRITNYTHVNNKVIWLSPWPQHFNSTTGK